MTAKRSFVPLVAFTVLASAIPVAAQDHPPMPAGMTHEQHQAQMKKDAELREHGGIAMGFEQDKATHHFTLTSKGGTIAVTANDPSDHVTRDHIQAHLQEIAVAFAKGDFEKPLMTHGEMPPGVAGMKRFKSEIRYTFERTDTGGVVRIATSNGRGLKAVHEFLRYQIREHKSPTL
jgi:hypothetical protein